MVVEEFKHLKRGKCKSSEFIIEMIWDDELLFYCSKCSSDIKQKFEKYLEYELKEDEKRKKLG